MSEAAVNTEPIKSIESIPSPESIKESAGAEPPTQESKGGGEAPEAPTYVPNYKYRVVDDSLKQDVEKEFDEWARPLVTKKEIEDKIRDLYTKSYGIDHVKSARDRYKKDYEAHNTELTGLRKSLGTLSQHIQSDDLHSFFSSLRIPEEKVLKYALERVNYHNLPPEKRAEYDQALDTRSRATLLQEENQRLQQESLRSQTQLREWELSQVTSSPEIRGVAEAYDSRIGIPGAFRNECIRRGAFYFQAHQQDVPPDRIAREVANEVVKLIGQPAITPVTQTGAPPPVEMQAQPERKPVIPNIEGKGTSPAKKVPRSIEDLKKLRSG